MTIKAAKRIFNSDKICCSYYDFYFGVTFLEHTVFQPGIAQDGLRNKILKSWKKCEVLITEELRLSACLATV